MDYTKQIIEKDKMIEVKWIDSHGVTSEWEFKDELTEMNPCECTSIGITEEKIYTDSDVKIFQSHTNNQILGRMTIPRCSVKQIRLIDIVLD